MSEKAEIVAQEDRPNLGALMARAVEQGEAGVAALERMIALNERVEAQRKESERKRAIAAARSEFTPVVKSGKSTHSVVSKDGRVVTGGYATLDDIQAMVDPVFARHGLSYRWDYEERDGKEWLVFVVEHENGTEEIRSRTIYAPDEGHGKNKLQARGSGESYAMRFTVKMGLAIRGVDPDDDAQTSEDTGPPALVTAEEALTLEARCEEVGADYKLFCAYLGVERLSELPASRLAEAIRALAKKAKARKA